MKTIKTTTCLGIAIMILSSIIPIASCTSEMETVTTAQTQTQNTNITTNTYPATGEALFQLGQNQEHSGNYSDAIQLYEQLISEFPNSIYAIQAYESIPRCHYSWGLQLEGKAQYSGEQTGGAIEHYYLILQEYPDSQYASKLKQLTADDPEIKTIASVEFDINSHFTGTVLNESSYYIVELVIYVQLYQDINQVYYKNIIVNGINPGEEKSFEEYPWVPLYGWDNLIWSFTEVWFRVI
jgi:tetratricopeptide (TPR) repeat protein